MQYLAEQLPLKRDVPKSSPGERAAAVPSAGISSSSAVFFRLLLQSQITGAGAPASIAG
jgi:hypothetical protein